MITRRETKQRRLVLEAVQSRHDHPTAEQIYEDVHQKIPISATERFIAI